MAEQLSLTFETGPMKAPAEQLPLVELEARGRRVVAHLPSQVWRALLEHEPTRARYAAKVHRRGPDDCWYWISALSSTGHGKLRAGPGSLQVVSAHVYGYQLAHGLIVARSGEDPVVAHRCDEGSCQNPAHLELIERTANGADYLARRHRAEGPLADERGAHGRAAAIRLAIRTAQAAGSDVEAAIEAASAAGLVRVAGLF